MGARADCESDRNVSAVENISSSLAGTYCNEFVTGIIVAVIRNRFRQTSLD